MLISHIHALKQPLLRGLQFLHTASARTLTRGMVGLSISSGHATALRRLWIRAAAKARLMFASGMSSRSTSLLAFSTAFRTAILVARL